MDLQLGTLLDVKKWQYMNCLLVSYYCFVLDFCVESSVTAKF